MPLVALWGMARPEVKVFPERGSAWAGPGLPADQARLHQLADEQAALRRVATLAVAEEVGRLLPVDRASMGRYEPDGTSTILAAWGTASEHFPVGMRFPLGGHDFATLVAQTGRPARIDNPADSARGPLAVPVREAGIRSAVGVPVIVEGRLWGVVAASSGLERPLPPDTEARLASFTELVATAIANADSRAELTEVEGGLARIAERVTGVFDHARELSHGIHPAILSELGLQAALKALARRSAVPVKLDLRTGRRLPDPVEVAAYYAVSEALANAAKHAQAAAVRVELDVPDGSLRLAVRDDGIGGADPARGSGLTGLRDRIEAVGGTFDVTSPAGDGTTLLIKIPV